VTGPGPRTRPSDAPTTAPGPSARLRSHRNPLVGPPSEVTPPTAQTIEPPTTPADGSLDTASAPTDDAGALSPRHTSFGSRHWFDRVDLFISRLSSRSHFWQRLTSWLWLPLAFKSGIRMKRVDASTFSAILPFRRFNRNWYNAMAGAALLANSEIAGGMYIFGICGGHWTVVCKGLEYKFLRPCFGPAVYKISPREKIEELIAAGKEFNVTIDMDIVQQSLLPEKVRPTAERMLPKAVGSRVAGKERRVGRCTATFHVTPKAHQQHKGRRIR